MFFTDKTGTAQRPSRVLRQGVPKYQKIKINEIFTFKFLASTIDRVSFIRDGNSFVCRSYFWYVSDFHCHGATRTNRALPSSTRKYRARARAYAHLSRTGTEISRPVYAGEHSRILVQANA